MLRLLVIGKKLQRNDGDERYQAIVVPRNLENVTRHLYPVRPGAQRLAPPQRYPSSRAKARNGSPARKSSASVAS